MELRQLRYFVTVVESGSLTRAASTLHVVQSALSQQMMQLESELGAPLLLRSVRGVQVTEAGSIFFRHAQAVLKQVENAQNAVLNTATSVRGPVAIGVPTSTAVVMASTLLARILHDYPEVRPTIIEVHSGQLAEMLANGRLDFSFLYHSNFLHGFEIRPVLAEPLCLYAQAGIPIPGYQPGDATVSLQGLAALPMILPSPANATRVLLDEACKSRGITLRVVAEAAGLDTVEASVAAGLGSTVLTAANIAKLRGPQEAQAFAPVIEPPIERTLVIARSRDFPMTQTARTICDLAHEIAIGMVKDGDWLGAQLITSSASRGEA